MKRFALMFLLVLGCGGDPKKGPVDEKDEDDDSPQRSEKKQDPDRDKARKKGNGDEYKLDDLTPQQKAVHRHLMENLDDPKSVEFVRWFEFRDRVAVKYRAPGEGGKLKLVKSGFRLVNNKGEYLVFPWIYFEGEPRATVSGKLTMYGSPLQNCKITFVGLVDSQEGKSKEDGSYEVEGVFFGETKVWLGLDGYKLDAGMWKYGTLKETPVKIEVKVDGNNLDINVGDATKARTNDGDKPKDGSDKSIEKPRDGRDKPRDKPSDGRDKPIDKPRDGRDKPSDKPASDKRIDDKKENPKRVPPDKVKDKSDPDGEKAKANPQDGLGKDKDKKVKDSKD